MQFYMPTKIYSQERCVLDHAKELAALGTKAMIVTGKNSARKTGALGDVTEALGSHGVPYVIFDRVEENPSVETVMEARKIALEEGVDFFIGIGGGSPMDASKAISLMSRDPKDDETILYTSAKKPYWPVACIPTTCGTGSEVTPYAILTRHAHRTKKSISHRIYPELALLDAKYLMTMPERGLVDTCVDALAHLLESYLNTNTNDLNRICSREGLAVWARFKDRLAQGTVTPSDHRDMLHASMIAGMSITHTGTSLPHGLSYPVTYELGIPHGRAVGMFLGGFVDTYPDREQATAAVNILGFRDTASFRAFLKELLGPVPVSEELIRESADKLMKDPGKLKNYPFPVDAKTMTEMVN